MAEALISSIAGEIVASLSSQAIENIGKLWGDKHELEALRERVSTLQALLDDAEEQSYQSREIKDWVDRLKGAFYDALDVLEEYNVEATRQGLRDHNKMFKEVRKFFSGSNQVAFILKMSYKVRAVKKRIETIIADRNFQLNTLPKREWRKRKETHSFACEGDIIGRDDDKKTVKIFLLDSDVKGNVSVLPIVGIGGLGKTTLAQGIYNDKMVEHFELKMWVCVSDDFDMTKIVKNILACVTNKVPNHDVLEQLQNELRGAINGRRYLLVLDDYWDEELNTWLKLKTLLVGGARGSKILITTRLHSVANITGTASPHLLGGLSEMESVDLLMQMAFPKGEETQDPDLRPIGEEIARRCSGVPLVVRTVGSLLFSKKTKVEWLHFRDYKLPEASRSEDEIRSVLRLSYNNLPSHLKRCFAFCSLFPKDHEIDKQTLVDLWVAEGFIKPSNTSEPLEDIAHEYFMNLLWSNFFQDFKKDPHWERETCKMHDLMHDLACSVAGNECCVVGNDTNSIDARARHIFVAPIADLPLRFPRLEASCLRTLLFFKKGMRNEVDLRQLMQSFKRLHVLDLRATKVEKVPRSICELKYLTYLDLSYRKTLRRLPNSITKLQSLQTLNLCSCHALEELPSDIKKLVSLRNLDISYCYKLSYLPRGIGELSSLHRLTDFILPQDKARAKNYCGLGELKGLNNIRGQLSIKNLGYVTNAEVKCEDEILMGKHSLESLVLRWRNLNTDDVVMDEVLFDRLKPPSNLQRLKIWAYNGESFPKWMMDSHSLVSFLPHLVDVSFSACERCERLPPLDQLPYLKSLYINNMHKLEYIGSDQSSPSPVSFPSLLKLEILACKKLKAMPLTPRLEQLDLTWANGALLINQMMLGLNKLKRLKIWDMRFSECLPEEGFQSLTSLESLMMSKCHQLTSLSQGMRHLSSLMDLSISDCVELDISKDESGNILDFHGGLHSLYSVYIDGLPKLTSLPQWLLHTHNLECLEIRNCYNLKDIPEQIEVLQSLQNLIIYGCSSLKSFPEAMRRLTSLTYLGIYKCGELEESCKRRAGEDWDKIAHIPNIRFG